VAFPLLKTVVESFDGSPPFLQRFGKSYRDPVLYLRGAVVGLGVGLWIASAMSDEAMASRAGFGFGVGVMAYAGVNLLRDFVLAQRGQGRRQSARVYLVQGYWVGLSGLPWGSTSTPPSRRGGREVSQLLAMGQPPKHHDVRRC